jgi:RNA polymerase sigma factor (sigma-70 family)
MLRDISTTWRRLHDPLRFTLTYGPAVRRYLLALLGDEHDADDVLQGILLQVTERGFATFDPTSDRRFRDYLKAVLRNAARACHQRRARKERSLEAGELDRLPRAEPGEAERQWLEEWRACVITQALRALERHQREAGKGNLAYTVVRLSLEHSDEDSKQLAGRASELSGQLLTPEAFRKQLSRARRTLAELIIAEVRQTLDQATDEQVLDELAELGLLGHVRDYLPADIPSRLEEGGAPRP